MRERGMQPRIIMYSPWDWGALSEPNVPDFICAKMFAGELLFVCEGGRGGTGGGGETLLLNNWEKAGVGLKLLTPVGSNQE